MTEDVTRLNPVGLILRRGPVARQPSGGLLAGETRTSAKCGRRGRDDRKTCEPAVNLRFFSNLAASLADSKRRNGPFGAKPTILNRGNIG
jgi:hypothetical protein